MPDETRVVLTVDKSSGEPAYLQIIRQIKRDVVLGIRRPGDRIPTVVELAESLGLARPTVGMAIKELANLGVVETRKSQGTVILPPSAKLINEYARDMLGPAVLECKRIGLRGDEIAALFAEILKKQFVERSLSDQRSTPRPESPSRRKS